MPQSIQIRRPLECREGKKTVADRYSPLGVYITYAYYRGNYDHLGAVAQSGEHLLCMQGVRGSNPLSSTIFIGFFKFQFSTGLARDECCFGMVQATDILKASL